MAEELDLYDFKMALCGNSDPEEFFLFVRNFQITLDVSKILVASTNIQYLCMLLHGEVLRQIDMFYIPFKPHYFGFRHVLFPINALSKRNHAMRSEMRKPCELKLRRYADFMVCINEYLAVFPGRKSDEKMCET